MASTITNYFTFSAGTTIRSDEMNQMFTGLCRGDRIPVDMSLAAADATRSYGLGTADYRWGQGYIENIIMGQTTGNAWEMQVDAATSGDIVFKYNNTIVARIDNSTGFVFNATDLNYTTTSVDYTLTANDNIVGANAGSATVTVTLPTAVGAAGRQVIVKKTDSGTDNVVIVPNGAELIDSLTSFELYQSKETIALVSDGSNWISYGKTYEGRFALLHDQKASGTDGGDASGGVWQVRTINTAPISQPWVSLTSTADAFRLERGRYKIHANAATFRTGGTRVILADAASTTVAIGETVFASTTDNTPPRPAVTGFVNITTATGYQILHYAFNSKGTDGLGRSSSATVNEVYTVVEIERMM